MAKFLPKDIPEDDWRILTPERDYAVRCQKGELIKIRFGTGVGLYFTFAPLGSGGIVVNAIDFDTGDVQIEAPFPNLKQIRVGRTDDCQLKIRHAIISRHHAEFIVDGTIIMIRDMGSTNGTSIFKDHVFFDVAEYLATHPVNESKDATLDWVHEAFGPTLGDFLKRYYEGKLK